MKITNIIIIFFYCYFYYYYLVVRWNLVLHGFDIFIHMVSFIILLWGRNIVFYLMKKFLLQMIGSWLVTLFAFITLLFNYTGGAFSCWYRFLDGVAWSNAIGIWLLMIFNIILLKKESWSWSLTINKSWESNINHCKLI